MNFHRSVRFRLVLWNVGVLAVILAMFGYALRLKIETDLMNGLDVGLEQGSDRFQELFNATGTFPRFLVNREITNGTDRQAASSFATTSNQAPIYGVSVIDLKGNVVVPGHAVIDSSSVYKSIIGQRSFSTSTLDGVRVRVFSTPLYRGKAIAFVLQEARSLSPLNTEMAGITRGLLTLIPLALLIVGIGAMLLTERALLPVRDIVDATERIEAKDLSGRLSVSGKDEFSHLAVTINGMLERLDKAFNLLREASDKQRRFTADASHELRTPLTIIKANTSLSLSIERTPDEYRRTLYAVDRAADRMSKIVMDLLFIARSDAGEAFLSPESLNLSSVIRQSVEAVADAESHRLIVDVDTNEWIFGDEESIVRLFANLLQNACKYTPASGTVTITATPKQGWCAIQVSDTGIGIAPEHLEHLGERFFRVDDARTRDAGGTGLGLAICRSIAESHGGSIQFESRFGVGTTVTVNLPASDTSEPSRQSEIAQLAKR